jgi:hypothetical protein
MVIAIDEDQVTELHAEQEPLLSFLTQVGETIRPVLPQEEQDSLGRDVATTARLLKEMGVSSSLTDPTNPNAWDTAYLSLAIGHEWNKAKNFSEHEALSEQLILTITKDDRTYIESNEGMLGFGFPDETVLAVMEKVFPDKVDSWNGKPLTTILKEMAVDGKIVLPYNLYPEYGKKTLSGKDILKSVYEEQHTPVEKQYGFAGLLHDESNVIILWQDTSKKTQFHEENHQRHDGLLIGNCGRVPDEAITELRTFDDLVRAGIHPDDVYAEKNQTSYRMAIKLIQMICEDFPGVESALSSHYDHKTVESSQTLARALIKSIGIDEFRRLYIAKPIGNDPILIKLWRPRIEARQTGK